jgi:hypothetical protein
MPFGNIKLLRRIFVDRDPSRESDSMIFWTIFICTLHDGPPGDSLLASDPS